MMSSFVASGRRSFNLLIFRSCSIVNSIIGGGGPKNGLLLVEVTLADCAACDQVALETDRVDHLMRGAWQRHQLKPRIILRTSSLEAVRSLVGAGLGLAVLPDFLYRPWTLDAEHVDIRPLRDESATVDVGLVWRRGLAVKPVAAELIELARELSRTRRPTA